VDTFHCLGLGSLSGATDTPQGVAPGLCWWGWLIAGHRALIDLHWETHKAGPPKTFQETSEPSKVWHSHKRMFPRWIGLLSDIAHSLLWTVATQLVKTWAIISDFRREVDVNCHLPDCYAASNGNSLPTFRDNLSVPASRVKKYWPLNYHYSLRNNPEERSSQDRAWNVHRAPNWTFTPNKSGFRSYLYTLLHKT